MGTPYSLKAGFQRTGIHPLGFHHEDSLKAGFLNIRNSPFRVTNKGKTKMTRIGNISSGQPVREAHFFSRSSKSLRSTFDLSSNKTRFSNSVFLPTCSYVLSNLALMLGMSSRIGLNSCFMDSISVPTSVTLNLSVFFTRLFIRDIIIERYFFVKQIISGKGANRQATNSLKAGFLMVAATFRLRKGDRDGWTR